MKTDTTKLILALFILVALLSLYYVQRENFTATEEETSTNPNDLTQPTFTYNGDSANITHVVDNINVNGQYLNIFQCKAEVNGYNPVGQYMKITKSPYTMASLGSTDWKKITSLCLLAKGGQKPMDYVMVWASQFLNKPPQQDFSIWRPIAPAGYRSLCDICVLGFSKPSSATNEIVCLPAEICESSPILKDSLLNIEESKLQCWNVSSHYFFKCANRPLTPQSSSSPKPRQIMFNQPPMPLVMSEADLKADIYNIKYENLNS